MAWSWTRRARPKRRFLDVLDKARWEGVTCEVTPEREKLKEEEEDEDAASAESL